jgi:hypothetical protein
MFFFNKVLSKIKKNNYIHRSKKISYILRSILKKKIGIIDVGAGQRYLPTFLNFDGVAKIAMVDPNKNLLWSYNNFQKIVKYPQNVQSFQFAISNKTKKIKYYEMRRSTGSTCINIYKKVRKNNQILNDEYFGKKNEKKIQAYSFNDFIKKFFYLKPDIIKIDVEGYELDIINSIIKKYDPFLIEVELNINHKVYGNTFNKVNEILTKKNYKLITGFPLYQKQTNEKNNTNVPFVIGDYQNPVHRSPLEQFDCVYIKNKKNYSLKTFSILVGYGFITEAKSIFEKLSKKISKSTCDKLNDIFENKYF